MCWEAAVRRRGQGWRRWLPSDRGPGDMAEGSAQASREGEEAAHQTLAGPEGDS